MLGTTQSPHQRKVSRSPSKDASTRQRYWYTACERLLGINQCLGVRDRVENLVYVAAWQAT